VAGPLDGQRPGVRSDSLSIQEFSRELRYGIPPDTIAAIGDPITAALGLIEEHPQHLQALLLARILSALTFGAGTFRKAEVFGLDRPARALAVALENVRTAGSVPNAVWESAVDAAGAAQAYGPREKPAPPPAVTGDRAGSKI
jgi:hypothetical protein